MAVEPKYQKVVDILRDRLLEELPGSIHSMVLSDSVARGEANDESDIDVLLITDGAYSIRKRVHEISFDIDFENSLFTQPIFLTVEGFEAEVRMRSWFSSDVLSHGIVIYDDGTYRRIRRKESSAVAGIPGG